MIYFLMAISLLTNSSVYSQSSFSDSIQTVLTNYQNNFPQEKAYLQTDKSFYLVGETVWFKAYVVNATTHQQMDLSKVLYVELLDDKSKPVLQTMIELQKGLGDGSFILPASVNSGMYALRAYTSWMKNFDAAFFFQTSIQIINTNRKPDWNSFEKKKNYSIQFFPEGGNLVSGIKTKLAFQLVNQYAKGVDGEGFIIENTTDTIVRFHPMKFGIGSFEFTPKKGVNYKAVVRLADGETIHADLPQIYEQGYVLQVSDAGKNQLRIECTSTETSNQTVYLLAHSKNKIQFSSSKIVINGKAEWFIDKSTLADGITTFTLFDAMRKPICERLYFKRPVHKMNIDVHTDAETYNTRSKVRIDLTTKDNDNQPIQGNLSLSVFLIDSLQKNVQPTIDQYFWLSSELRGNIESPGYYLNNDNEEVNAELDNLMLTHGWRRFKWEDWEEKRNSAITYLPDYEGLIIKGKVINKISGAPVPNVLCYLSVPGEKFYVGNAISDENGELNFVTKNIYGPVELIAQPGSRDSNLRVELFHPYPQSGLINILPPFILNEKWKDLLNARHLNVQIANSFALPAQQLYAPLQNDTTAFYGKPDNAYLLDQYTRFPTMEEVMREIVAEVRVQKEKDSFHFRMLNTPYRLHFDSDPLILLDGVPVFDANKIIAFDPLKVKKVEVVARKYYWGNTVNNGIVSYTTYDGNLAGFELDPNVLLMDYNGLQVKREFYAPSYSTPEQLKSREPDRRNVLLWSPYVSTDTSGQQQIYFYTSDVPGRYAINVQGIDADGRLGSKDVFIEVK